MMNFRYILFPLSIIFFLVGMYLTSTDFFEVGFGLKAFSRYLIAVGLLLLFVTDQGIIRKIKIFSLFFIPATIFIILLQSPNGNIWNPLDPGKTTMALWLGTTFLILSSSLIFFGSKKEKERTP